MAPPIRRVLIWLWKAFIGVIEVALNIVVDFYRADRKLNQKFVQYVVDINEAARKEKHLQKTGGWEDDVAVFSKVPHEEKKTNKDGEYLRVTINSRKY
jgi:hypothetical protein